MSADGFARAQAELVAAAQQLTQGLEATRAHWDDDGRHRFDAQHLDPLLGEIRALLAGLDEVASQTRAATQLLRSGG